MRRTLIAFLVCVSGEMSFANDTEYKVPSPNEIRTAFDLEALEWKPIPNRVLVSLVAASDPLFFEKPPFFSRITREIGRWYPAPSKGRLFRMTLATRIGEALSHDEILRWYANNIFLGRSCFGVADATHAYFGKPIDQLDLNESALLAALHLSPSSHHPFRQTERATQRRNLILEKLAEMGAATQDQVTAASLRGLGTLDPLGECELD